MVVRLVRLRPPELPLLPVKKQIHREKKKKKRTQVNPGEIDPQDRKFSRILLPPTK